MANAQEVKFKRKTSSEIQDLPIEDGSLIYDIETGRTYLDNGNSRIPTGGQVNFDLVDEYSNSESDGYVCSYINSINNDNMKLIFGSNGNTWRSTGTYKIGDIVTYNNKVYKNMTGTYTSTNPESDTTNWVAWSIYVGAGTKSLSMFQQRGEILWQNSNPTSSFSSQNVTLNSARYEEYVLYYKVSKNDNIIISQRSLKGYGTHLYGIGSSSSFRRIVNYVSDTKLTIGNIDIPSGGSNDFLIPLFVIGYENEQLRSVL